MSCTGQYLRFMGTDGQEKAPKLFKKEVQREESNDFSIWQAIWKILRYFFMNQLLLFRVTTVSFAVLNNRFTKKFAFRTQHSGNFYQIKVFEKYYKSENVLKHPLKKKYYGNYYYG